MSWLGVSVAGIASTASTTGQFLVLPFKTDLKKKWRELKEDPKQWLKTWGIYKDSKELNLCIRHVIKLGESLPVVPIEEERI